MKGKNAVGRRKKAAEKVSRNIEDRLGLERKECSREYRKKGAGKVSRNIEDRLGLERKECTRE